MSESASEPEPTVAMRTAAPSADVDFDMGELDAPAAASAPTAPAPLKAAPSGPAPLEFDLGELSLDLPGQSAAPSAAADSGNDSLETKLALAVEFQAIGDTDGARSLVQEVANEASGSLKARATKMLADLG